MVAPTLSRLVAVAVLVVLAGCGGSDSSEPEPSDSATAPAYEQEATFTDTGDEPSSGRLSEIIAALTSLETGPIDACPLGDDSTFLRGVALEVQDPDPLRSNLQESGAAGDVPTIRCTSNWMLAEVSAVGEDLTVDEAIENLARLTPALTFSEPQPLMGGTAFTHCLSITSTEDDGNTACGAVWIGDGLFVQADLLLTDTTGQDLADYLTEVLPLWVGTRS